MGAGDEWTGVLSQALPNANSTAEGVGEEENCRREFIRGRVGLGRRAVPLPPAWVSQSRSIEAGVASQLFILLPTSIRRINEGQREKGLRTYGKPGRRAEGHAQIESQNPAIGIAWRCADGNTTEPPQYVLGVRRQANSRRTTRSPWESQRGTNAVLSRLLSAGPLSTSNKVRLSARKGR